MKKCNDSLTITAVKVNGVLQDPESFDNAPVLEDITYNPYGKNILSFTANVSFGMAVKYSYTVHGKTSDADFVYSYGEYTINPIIPVVGLYATGRSNITFIFADMSGNEYEISATTMDFTDVDIGVHRRSIVIELLDTEMVEATIGNGWLFDDLINAYDKNGDLRVTGFTGPTIHFPQFSPMKIHNNGFYIQSEHTAFYYSERYDRYSLIGELLNSYVAPENYGFHHDITWDDQGYVYILGSPLTDEDPLRANDEITIKREGTIYKYEEETGVLVSSIEYSDLYDGSATIADSVPNDVHFNSITYVKEIDQLVVNSRNSCTYMGIDKRTLTPIWIVDNPDNPVEGMPGTALLLPEIYNMTVINPSNYIYVNGAHTVFITYNEKYAEYWGNNKIVMSILDNVACKDAEGNDIMVLQEDAQEDAGAGYAWDTAVQIVAIDLHARTIEQLDRFTMSGERSRVTSNVFDSENKRFLQVYHGVPANFFVIDTEGNVGVRARGITANNEWSYRARVFSYYEIQNIVTARRISDWFRYDDLDPRITYSGPWNIGNSPNYYMGGQHNLLAADGEATFSFEGSMFTIIGSQDYRRGHLDVIVDGDLIGTCNFDSPGSYYPTQQIVFRSSEFTTGVHNVQLISYGSVQGGLARLDAIDIKGRLLEN